MDQYEVTRHLRRATSIDLVATPMTKTLVIAVDAGRPHLCMLFGPYRDRTDEPYDTRIFVVYRSLEGHRSLQLLVQDADDDCFLNHNAEGAERWDVGNVYLTPQPQGVEDGPPSVA